ncbi:MAG TPA: lamin tail domain-containing protein, partial [Bacteroidales bacterium]|nr:lamin tail domain-containing protein [Bacteroidales bacterium]
MKKVILLALLMPYMAFGQIVDNFESQSTANWVQSYEGHWKADTVSRLSGLYSLHHVYDNPDAGTEQIGLSIKNLHPEEGTTRWSFLVRYGYDPSSLNNWSAFLMCDIGSSGMSAEGTAKGYAIGVNLAGSDDTLRLWKIKGSQIVTVVKTRINWQTDIGTARVVRILTERTADGHWTVTVSGITGSVIGSASGTDSELFGSEWFGIYYKYSSTRDRLLWIDDVDIAGIFHENTTVTPVMARTGDLIISEIMADPTPEVSLPPKEYIEIINRTDSPYNLEDWKLSTESQSVVFPDVTLPASGIAILCSPGDTSF